MHDENQFCILITANMDFGKIVKNAAYSKGISAAELAFLIGISESELLVLYEQADWTSGNIILASQALEYNFGKYFNTGNQFDFLNERDGGTMNEFNITIKYPAGKEFLLNTWLQKMAAIAKVIGLQVGK